MPIEAVSQTTSGPVHVLSQNEDLNVADGVTLYSQTSDAIVATAGQHVITVSGLVKAFDDAIITDGCLDAQTVVIEASGRLIAGYTGGEPDGDGVLLGGSGSTVVNHGSILASGSGIAVIVHGSRPTTLTNSGYILGETFGVQTRFGAGTLHFTNTGTVESAGAAFSGGTGIDRVTNSGIFKGDVVLNGGNDLYLGQSGVVYGLIEGGDGDDRFVLGNAPDKVIGGSGFDTLDFSSAADKLTIDLTHPEWNQGAAVLGDRYFGVEAVIGGTRADTLRGNAADNALSGGIGSDLIAGGGGDDSLSGGSGHDLLSGGAGADVFAYAGRADFRDTITDFEAGIDLFRFEGQTLGFGSLAGGLDPARFRSGLTNAAEDLLDRFIFRTGDATLWFDRDGAGTGHAAVLVADLQDGVLLSAASIEIV